MITDLQIGGDQVIKEVVAENLKRYRLQKDWTQEDLSAETKPRIRVGTVNRVENAGNTTVETLEILARALGKTVADLLEEPKAKAS